MHVTPYLDFDGRCDEALAFYAQAIGAKLDMMLRFKDMPPGDGPRPSSPPEKVMHCAISIGDTTLFASDGRCTGQGQSRGVMLNLCLDGKSEAERTFDALAEGGRVDMPLTRTFFAEAFGMVCDRFGIVWQVMVR